MEKESNTLRFQDIVRGDIRMEGVSRERRIFFLLPRALQTFVWIPARLCFRIFAQFTIRGVEHIRRIPRSVVFASNHMSEIDPILVPTALHPFSPQFPVFYVARGRGGYQDTGTIKSRLYGGFFFNMWGAYPVLSGQRNYERALVHHTKILEHGGSVQIFPVGKLNKNGFPQEQIHGGVAYLAWKTGAPVVPVALKGTAESSLKNFFSREKKYSIVFGKPIVPADLFKNTGHPRVEEFRIAAARIMEEVRGLYEAA